MIEGLFDAAKVDTLWRKATTRGPNPDQGSLIELAVGFNAAASMPRRTEEADKLNSEARSAASVLLNWCRRDVSTNIRPIQQYRYAEEEQLEAALGAVSFLMAAPPHRQPDWFYQASFVWDCVSLQLVRLKREAGSGPSTVAIKMTSLVLEAMGFENVTVNAVSHCMREHWRPDSRNGAERRITVPHGLN